MSDAWPVDSAHAADFERAIELREDGDYEESAALFETLISDGASDPKLVLEYAKTLCKLERFGDADAALTTAIAQAPGDFTLRRAWAEMPRHEVNYAGTIERGRILRTLFPPAQCPGSWESLAVEFDCLYEMAEWGDLEETIYRNWDHLTASAEMLPHGISALAKLFLTDEIGKLATAASPDAWSHMPDQARERLIERAEISRLNREAVAKAGISLISLGQNCLPYQLAGRWGLIAPRADPGYLTPFDLGGFNNDSAAGAIATDFAAFGDRDHFTVTKAWGGGKMYLHRPSHVGFFHERGSHWVTPDGARFFNRLALMVANWEVALLAPRRLFVFCYCGAGDLSLLVQTMAGRHLNSNSHLLVIDVLQDPHSCPSLDEVTYRHIPYPKNYDWTRVQHQCSAAGHSFELAILGAIAQCMGLINPACRDLFGHLPTSPRDRQIAAPAPLTNMDLIGRHWQFGNIHGHALTTDFKFGAGGMIEGYHNENETSWACDQGTLKIYKRNGELMWTGSTLSLSPSGDRQIILHTPLNSDVIFQLTEMGPITAQAVTARPHRYSGVMRVMVLDNGLDIPARFSKLLASADIFHITREDEIDRHPACAIFIAGLVLTHAGSAAEAAGFVSRMTSRFALAIFVELSAAGSNELGKSGLQSFHRGFDENKFMDELSIDFVATAADQSQVYKVEHYAQNPAFDSFKNWVVPTSHPRGTYDPAAPRGDYLVFERPVFEMSIYACHRFDALDVPLAQDIILVESRLLRFRGQASGFRLSHFAHAGDIGPELYRTSTDAALHLRERPISTPQMLDDHPKYQNPRNQDIIDRWRQEFKIEIAELAVHELQNCVIGGTGTIFSDGRFVAGTDYLLMYLNSSSLDPIMRGLERRHPQQHVEGVAIVGFNALYDNYYHWVAEALASMNLCLELIRDRNLKKITLITGKLNATRREYLEILLKGENGIEIVDLERDQFITADDVIYCDNLGRIVYQQVCWEEVPMIDKLIANCGLTHAPLHRLIYVARTDTKGRTINNERALIDRLATMGFEIIVGSQHSVADQIRIFREAKFIIGGHGAGLTNILYSQPGAVLLELHQSIYMNTGMMRLAQLNNLHYYSEVFFQDDFESDGQSWSVDIDRIFAVAHRLIYDHFGERL